MLSRRTFLHSSAAALATRLFAAPADAKKPNPELAKLGAVALGEARKLKASYCDIRIIRSRQQFLNIRLNPERGTGKTLEVPGVGDGGSFGFGVRVIVDGAWGFAASPLVKPEEIARITAEAVQVAKANASLMNKPVVLAPVPAYTDYWQTPHQRDPFEVPIQEKLELIRNAAAEAKKSQQVFSAACTLAFRKEDKYFASSVGSSIQQLNMQTYGIVNSTAVDVAKGLSKTRRFQPPPVTAGYEFVAVMNLVENAQRVREEVVEHLNFAARHRRQEGSGAASQPPLAHHPRITGTLYRTGPRAGLRGELCRHQLPHHRQTRQGARRQRPDQRLGRSHQREGSRDRRLRR